MKNIFKYAVVGAGAAGLSCIHILNKISNKKILVIDKNIHTQKNHFFGYWKMPWTEEVDKKLNKYWNSWSMIDDSNEIEHTSKKHPYTALELNTWKDECLKEKEKIKIKENYVENIAKTKDGFELTLDNKEIFKAEEIINSRTIKIEKKILKQHFLGHLIETNKEVFNQDKLILMDFRVDQSKGIHFIYLLPFTNKKALVESTMFSFNIEDDVWYKNTINDYLKNNFNIDEWRVISEEKGIIPMTVFNRPKNNFINIGIQSGAIKPSSGYAFSFIQKQLLSLKDINFQKEKFLYFDSQERIDKWMDLIFLKVLETYPKLAVNIFINLAKGLNGDEFAIFMSGKANMSLRLKVMLKMPKKPFLKVFFNYLIGK